MFKKSIFLSNNYQMKNSYDSRKIVIANLQYISSEYTEDVGPMLVTTKQKYLFEKLIKKDKIKYREVFTGLIVETDSNIFDLPYVINVKELSEEIADVADYIPKYGLLLLLDEINKNKKYVYKTLKNKTK